MVTFLSFLSAFLKFLVYLLYHNNKNNNNNINENTDVTELSVKELPTLTSDWALFYILSFLLFLLFFSFFPFLFILTIILIPYGTLAFLTIVLYVITISLLFIFINCYINRFLATQAKIYIVQRQVFKGTTIAAQRRVSLLVFLISFFSSLFSFCFFTFITFDQVHFAAIIIIILEWRIEVEQTGVLSFPFFDLFIC